MKTLFIPLLIIASHFASAQPTNKAVHSRDSLTKRVWLTGLPNPPLLLAVGDEKVPVWFMEPLESQAVKELVPDFTAYRLISSQDPIHMANFSALVVDTKGCPNHLKTDAEVGSFLGDLTKAVKTKEDALRLVRAFADLRSYTVIQAPPAFPDAREPGKRPPEANTDYKFVAEERDNHWRVHATFLTSEYGWHHHRYVFRLYKQPGSGMGLDEPVLIRLKYFMR
jgi:hypothetical protein